MGGGTYPRVPLWKNTSTLPEARPFLGIPGLQLQKQTSSFTEAHPGSKDIRLHTVPGASYPDTQLQKMTRPLKGTSINMEAEMKLINVYAEMAKRELHATHVQSSFFYFHCKEQQLS